MGTGDILLTERYLTDNSWPSDLILDLDKSNWPDWSKRLNLLAIGQGFGGWLNGTLQCPDVNTHPRAYWIWKGNDDSLRAFILKNISAIDYEGLGAMAHTSSAHLIYQLLRQRHEKLGLWAQLNFIKKALDIRISRSTSISAVITDIRRLYNQIMAVGPINPDQLFTAFLINAMGDEFPHLQSQMQAMTKDPNFSSNDIVTRLQEEESVMKRREEQGGSSALVTTSGTPGAGNRTTRQKLYCANCKRTNHNTDFCIRQGGKMAGKSIEEARVAQRVALGKPPKSTPVQNSAHIATESSTDASASLSTTSSTMPPAKGIPITLNGTRYFPETSTTSADTANLATHDSLLAPGDLFEYHAFVAVNDDLRTSVNWADYSRITDDGSVDTLPMAYTSSSNSPSRDPIVNLRDVPFILDTGATCHISPERSDFKTLHPTPPHPVKGIGNACVYALGMGTVELTIAGGHKITLDNVLFIPSSSVHLLSVLTFNRLGGYTSHFDSHSCWVTKRDGTTILRGNVIEHRRLYELVASAPRVTHRRALAIPSVLYTTRTPNIETWHRRLGHCNVRTIIDMAKSHSAKGMSIDLSIIPPKCSHCILGKQTRTSVPKVREGPKATQRLERIYVDLTGPMSVTSRSGKKYLMNIIDDITSYIWSIPLNSKDEAAKLLPIWQRTIENQSNERIKILVTDNGELVSRSVAEWCTLRGIEHKLTAPYTSAQNGRAEHVHRTIMNKARSMRLACNAPAALWDKFCATATYLTTLTASVTLNGKTPYEAWYGEPPSLSRLREIGCRAFAFIPTNQPKVLQRSVPCILVGYAPNAKAYRLWDPTIGKVFNSFHVSFVEHLDAAPADFMPGETIQDNTPPTWNALSDLHPKLPPSPPPDISPSPSTPNPVHVSTLYRPISTSLHPIPIPSHFPSNSATTSTPPSPLTPLPRSPSLSTLRRSSRIASLQANLPEQAQSLFSEFIPFHNTHDLIYLEFSDPFPTIDSVLTALNSGTVTPVPETSDDPSWAEAMASPDREYWIAGARDELKSLADLKVFALVPRSEVPQGQGPLKGKLVCKRKRDDNGNITRYKVRYVAKGFAQRYGVDYDKTSTPTARLKSLRLILHIAASLNWDIHQFDIKTAFLHGVLPDDETMFLEQPPGFKTKNKEDWVMKLFKSIYGMKQASRVWNQTFNKAVENWNFIHLPCEWCVYYRQSSTGATIFVLHVDDIISASSSVYETNRFREELKGQWEISDLGPVKHALGIAISCDLPSHTIHLSQTALIDCIIEQFGQRDAHPSDTPMVQGLHIERPDKLTHQSDKSIPYQELVGSLMYIANATRPDIVFAVGHLTSVMDCYTADHWKVAVRVLHSVAAA